MTDPIDALYAYAQEHVMPGLLAQENEYENALRCVERRKRAVRALLDEKNAQQFKDLLGENDLLAFFQGKASFRAGVQVGAALLR